MKRIGILAGSDTPRDDESADALDTLIGIYRRFIYDGAFGELSDHLAHGATVARENSRIIRNTTDDVSITLPEVIQDCGRERPPRDCAVVVINDQLTGQSVEYLYDGSAKQWVELTKLTLTSAAPLAGRDPQGLACYLAIELADEYGQTPSELTLRNAARFQMGLVNNWSNPQAVHHGVYY